MRLTSIPITVSRPAPQAKFGVMHQPTPKWIQDLNGGNFDGNKSTQVAESLKGEIAAKNQDAKSSVDFTYDESRLQFSLKGGAHSLLQVKAPRAEYQQGLELLATVPNLTPLAAGGPETQRYSYKAPKGNYKIGVEFSPKELARYELM